MRDLDPEQRRRGAHKLQVRPGQAPQRPFACFMGPGGQVVYIPPEQDVVVVRFGGAAQLLHSSLDDLAPT